MRRKQHTALSIPNQPPPFPCKTLVCGLPCREGTATSQRATEDHFPESLKPCNLPAEILTILDLHARSQTQGIQINPRASMRANEKETIAYRRYP